MSLSLGPGTLEAASGCIWRPLTMCWWRAAAWLAALPARLVSRRVVAQAAAAVLCQHTLRQRCRGSHRYSVILSTRMQPIVLTASALISGFGS